MSNRFQVTLSFPPVEEFEQNEVVQRRLVINNGVDPPVEHFIPASQPSFEYEGLQGQHHIVSLENVDDAGNRSTSALVREFDILDTTPPSTPTGEIGVTTVELP